jgi:hypothetical protein
MGYLIKMWSMRGSMASMRSYMVGHVAPGLQEATALKCDEAVKPTPVVDITSSKL